MFDLIFLSDPATSSRPWEIVVAVLIIVITGVALFFLYRNVLFHFKKNKLERDNLKSEKSKEEKSDNIPDNVSRNPLLAEINKDIAEIKEGDLRLFFAINLDNFRYIVDSYEQKDINKVIDEYTKRLKKYCQKGSLSGHYEQDIFIYYYRGEINNEKINQIAAELLDLFKSPVKLGNHELTASIGICLFPYDGITAENLLKNAEIAVYVAKKEGKNRFYMYSQNLIEKEQFNIDYYKQIKKSIENDEFLLYYQPIVDIRTGKIIGLESLLRWQHPTMGILSPGKFLNVMDLTGDITWFGIWGFEKVTEQYAAWKRNTKLGDFFISINLAPKQLYVDGLARQYFEIAGKHGLTPENFCLEILDYYTVINNEIAQYNLKEFRRYGFRMAIDDTGMDYQLAEDMSKILASIVKISRGNLLLITSDDANSEKIKKVIDQAKANQKIVIAEGVEDEDTIRLLNKWDIRFMQGFHFSEPVSVVDAEKMIRKSPWDMFSFNHLIK
ncbi:MAG: GGDEF and EAL domain-containing protein [Candidatus Izemoplasmatales bacterium]|nr:GGDEF and EAL domain-containing protein [Candidatus Izemoplasmatales bacterium]